MRKYVCSVAVVLSGCVMTPPITLPQAEAACASAPFVQFGQCIAATFDSKYPEWRKNQEADLAQVYIAWLDAAAMRVQNGSMQEADARLGALELRTRLYEIVSQRRMSAAISQQAAVSQMLSGLALMNASQPQPVYVPPQATTPAMPITCTQYPVNSVTGQIRTVCH